MSEEQIEAFRASLHRNLTHLQEERDKFEDGEPPPSLVAESDQFTASSGELLGVFIQVVRKHRAGQMECCKREANCVGFELPLLLASVSEVAIGHVLGALTVAAGRLAALPEEEVPGGPLRFG